jgi:hypothetical protein
MKVLNNSFILDNDKEVFANIVVMEKSCFVWIGNDLNNCSFGNMVTAIPTRFEKLPISTNIVCLNDDGTKGSGFAERFSKRFQIQTFVAYSLPDSFDDSLCKIEEKLVAILDLHFER